MKTDIPSRAVTGLAFLDRVQRPLLERLLERFQSQFSGAGTAWRADHLEDGAFRTHLHLVLIGLPSWPAEFIEVLGDLQAMACADGQEHIERVLASAGTKIHFPSRATRADMAVATWLAAPEAFQMARSELRLTRLVTFEYYGASAPAPRPPGFTPHPEQIHAMQAEMDEWFCRHGRGEETTQIQAHSMDDEWWFLVRHGDTYASKAKVERRHTELLHYRPAKDDVVVYCPQRDDLRIHAGTAGETELYRQVFGRRLFGSPHYFNERKAYTLAPLRLDGPEALRVHDIAGIQKIKLREIEVLSPERASSTVLAHECDLFAENPSGLPDGQLQRARFDVFFNRSARPRVVEIRPPNVLKLGRHCDAAPVHRWIGKRGFRTDPRSRCNDSTM